VAATLVAVYRDEGPLSWAAFDKHQAKKLLSYGGWVSVSGVISPILTSLDQLVIGSVLNVAAVAHYAVPMNLILRSQILPSAMTRTLFPRFSHSEVGDANMLAKSSAIFLACSYAVLVGPGIFAMHSFMQLWLGSDFAVNARGVGEILLVGAWINGLAFIPGGLLQARGRPDVVAKFHVLELFPFLGILWVSAHFFGLPGIAAAWTIRVSSDAVLLFVASGILDLSLILRLSLLLSLLLVAMSTVLIFDFSLTEAAVAAFVSTVIIALVSGYIDMRFRKLIVSVLTLRPNVGAL